MTGLRIVPSVATEEMVEAMLEESGQRITAYTAPRESGVAIDSDISEDEAASFNRALMDAHAETYAAAIEAAPALTDEQIDALAEAYETTHKHGPADHWQKNADSSFVTNAPIHIRRREEGRTRMRAFILAIHGA